MPSVLQRIRQKILQKEFVFSSHAIDEMLEDEICPFAVEDVKRCLLSGSIRKRETDFNGTKYTIRGETSDGLMEVVVRFRADGKLFIITNYIVE